MRRPLRIACAFLASMALALTSTAAAIGDDSPASISSKRCADLDIGFTNASVRAKRVRCGKAHSVVKNWLRKAEDECELGVCPPIEVKGFTCRRDDEQYTIILRCKMPVGKVVVGRWGD